MTASANALRAAVPARYYIELPRLLGRHGINAAEVWDAAGISPTLLNDPEAQLSLEELERLVSALMGIGGRDLPLELGRSIRLRNHALVGYAMLSSPTVDYAMRLTSRFFRLVFPAFRMQYRVTPQGAEMRFLPTLAMSSDCLAFHIEMLAVAALTDVQELIQGALPHYDLELSIPAPLHRDRYHQLMPQARLHFAALPHPGLCLRLPTSILGEEPAMANAASLAVAEQRCRQLVDHIVSSGNIGAWTRMMLRESNDGLPSIEELAATLNINSRTLHRHLKREGLVYRQLCVEERSNRARQLLAGSRLSITRIAQELGYSDASNFTRAFRAAVGCSPSDYRAEYGVADSLSTQN